MSPNGLNLQAFGMRRLPESLCQLITYVKAETTTKFINRFGLADHCKGAEELILMSLLNA